MSSGSFVIIIKESTMTVSRMMLTIGVDGLLTDNIGSYIILFIVLRHRKLVAISKAFKNNRIGLTLMRKFLRLLLSPSVEDWIQTKFHKDQRQSRWKQFNFNGNNFKLGGSFPFATNASLMVSSSSVTDTCDKKMSN